MNNKIANDLIRYAELVEDGALISPEEMNCASVMRLAAEALAQTSVSVEQKPKCNPHPKAPHGFDRNASHANDRYICECEGWDAYDAGYEAGVIAGIEASMEQEPEQRSDSEHLEPTKLWCETCEGTGEVYQEHQAGCHVGGHFKCPDCDGEGYVLSRLYSTTPPQHSAIARKPLTIDQIASIAIDRSKPDGIIAFVRAIEAAHGITASEAEDSARSKT